MCGIAGVIMWQGLPDAQKLQLAADSLWHRGPDHTGIYIKDNVALVHARLSIIDLAGGDQPLHNRDKSLHLVANGEVYNYIELRNVEPKKDASLTAYTPQTQSDCEAVLQVYEQHGAEGFGRLNGMFAFALYDDRKQSLLLCRDRLGIKPLFYTATPKGLFFASEIKALLPLLDKQPEIHDEALLQFLQYQFHSGRNTIFNGIHRWRGRFH